jgi:hypothetical protein
MRVIEDVDVATVRAHEEATDSNVRLCGYDMPVVLSEVRASRVLLDADDIARLFLLGIGGLDEQTRCETWRVADVLPSARTLDRVWSFIGGCVDLRARPELSLVIVTAGDERPLTLIDGNHRAMAQFLAYGTMEGVPAFVCVHPGFAQWSYIPPLARCSVAARM